MVLSSIAAAIALGKEAADVSFLMAGFLLVGSARLGEDYWAHVQDKTDERGGPATFSIWLLYWVRILRGLFLSGFCFFPILAILELWRTKMLVLTAVCILLSLALLVVRVIGMALHRRIDRLGPRFGFVATNQHDYPQPPATPPASPQPPMEVPLPKSTRPLSEALGEWPQQSGSHPGQPKSAE
jgi:hypothetical protein